MCACTITRRARSRRRALRFNTCGVRRKRSGIKAAAGRAALAAAGDQDFFKPWSLLSGGAVVFTMPRMAVLRSFVLNHSIHHRAHLCVYLRLNNIPVPGMYGPSADEAGM